jgi:hypothetical protein
MVVIEYTIRTWVDETNSIKKKMKMIGDGDSIGMWSYQVIRTVEKSPGIQGRGGLALQMFSSDGNSNCARM